jgi:hypothetical protein
MDLHALGIRNKERRAGTHRHVLHVHDGQAPSAERCEQSVRSSPWLRSHAAELYSGMATRSMCKVAASLFLIAPSRALYGL